MPVWPSGKAGKQRDLGSNPLSSKIVVCGYGLATLFLTINEIVKWLLTAGVILVVTVQR